jgi:uncharacterized protein YndB with AHSA1/START domain
MKDSKKTIEIKVERTIPAPPCEVFDAWLNPKTPGNPWNAAEKFIGCESRRALVLDTQENAHYGRFRGFERAGRIQHTWVSPNTLGQESTVTVTFKKQGQGTRITLVHSNLPDTDEARGHERGWNYFLGIFRDQLGSGSRKEYRWEDAHPRAAVN